MVSGDGSAAARHGNHTRVADSLQVRSRPSFFINQKPWEAKALKSDDRRR